MNEGRLEGDRRLGRHPHPSKRRPVIVDSLLLDVLQLLCTYAEASGDDHSGLKKTKFLILSVYERPKDLFPATL